MVKYRRRYTEGQRCCCNTLQLPLFLFGGEEGRWSNEEPHSGSDTGAQVGL